MRRCRSSDGAASRACCSSSPQAADRAGLWPRLLGRVAQCFSEQPQAAKARFLLDNG